MKKLTLYFFLGLMFCNVGFASPKGKSLYCYKDNYDQLDRGNFDYEKSSKKLN